MKPGPGGRRRQREAQADGRCGLPTMASTYSEEGRAQSVKLLRLVRGRYRRRAP